MPEGTVTVPSLFKVGVLVAPTTSVVVVTTVRITSVVVGVLVPNLSLSNTVPVVVVVLVPLVTV